MNEWNLEGQKISAHLVTEYLSLDERVGAKCGDTWCEHNVKGRRRIVYHYRTSVISPCALKGIFWRKAEHSCSGFG